MKNQEQKPSFSPAAKAAAIAAAVIAVVGLLILITTRVQQADPTLTQAPPAGPQAVTLAPSSGKSQHPGPMYVMTPSGPAMNQASNAAPQSASVQPVIMTPGSGTTQ